MKHYVVFIVMAFSCVVSFSQNITQDVCFNTFVNRYGQWVGGPKVLSNTKTVTRIIKGVYYVEGYSNRYLITDCFKYDELGKIVSIKGDPTFDYSDNKIENVTKLIYKDNRVIKELAPLSEYNGLYEYDKNGLLLKSFYDGYVTVYSYLPQGYMIKVYIDGGGFSNDNLVWRKEITKKEKVETIVEYDENDDKTIEVRVYNDKGNIIKQTIKNENGEFTSYFDYKYDSNGNIRWVEKYEYVIKNGKKTKKVLSSNTIEYEYSFY